MFGFLSCSLYHSWGHEEGARHYLTSAMKVNWHLIRTFDLLPGICVACGLNQELVSSSFSQTYDLVLTYVVEVEHVSMFRQTQLLSNHSFKIYD